MRRTLTLSLFWLFACCFCACFPGARSLDAQQTKSAAGSHAAAHGGTPIAKEVATDLDGRLEKFHVVKMPYSMAALSLRERLMMEKLVEACRALESIYWRQSDPEGLMLYKQLANATHAQDQKVRRYLTINGSRFGLVEENRPFVGNLPMPPGRGLYPEKVTRAQLEEYVALHPEKKAEIYDPYTVIEWYGKDFRAVKYHEAYKQWLLVAADDLRAAAKFSDDRAFADFLKARADALLSDDYYPSDLKWVDLKDPKFDIIFAPYETYLDDILGIKTSYGAAILVRNEEESKKLAVFQRFVPDVQDALPLAPEDRPSKHGQPSPMEVMDSPFRAGDLRHGYQAVADNLPNDPRIHQEKGTKKIFFKNFMDARVNYVILPLAKRVMAAAQAAQASEDGYLAVVMMHEICHGLGPAYSRTAGGQKDIREAIGPAYSGLEEAKADVVGMFGLQWLMDHGGLPKARLQEYYASYVSGIFRTVRFGVGEAHGRAEMMEFNYLQEHKAIGKDPQSGRYSIDYAAMPSAIASLAKELLEIEATGDRQRAESWFSKYDRMPDDLKALLTQAADIPVDIDPVGSIKEVVR